MKQIRIPSITLPSITRLAITPLATTPLAITHLAITIAWLALVGLFLMSLAVGPVSLSASEIFQALFSDEASVNSAHRVILLEIRLPRFLAAFLAGAALGASGAALQGLLRNPLADPGVLGVSSSAALGAVAAVYFGFAQSNAYATTIFAIGGALAATLALFILGARHVSTTRLILIGVGLSAFAGAMISLLMNLAPNPFVLSDLVNWLFGSVANRSLDETRQLMRMIAIGLGITIFGSRGLAALGLGEETALSLGINLTRMRALLITGSAIMTGASVALAGAIGFVGVVAPHLARPLAGHDPGRTILPAALIGGMLLAGADIIIRILPFTQELKLGVVAALIGAPGFVWIAARTRSLSR